MTYSTPRSSHILLPHVMSACYFIPVILIPVVCTLVSVWLSDFRRTSVVSGRWRYRLVVVWLLPFFPSLSLPTSIDRSRLQIRVFLVRRMLKMGAGFRLFHSWYSSSKKNMHGSSKHSGISCDSVAVDGTRFGPVLVSRARLDLIC